MARAVHVDEVDDDQATGIADAQLACDFGGGFQIGVERGVFDIAALEAREQRYGVLVELELAQVVRHDLLDELAGVVVELLVIDQDLANIVAQIVAQGADDQFRFLVDQERRRTCGGRFGDRLPQLQQIIEIPLQLFGFASHAGGADDQAHLIGQLQLIHRIFQILPILALDAARDATGTGVVRHQHEISAGQADEGGQGRALVAALFLVDLDDDGLSFLDQLADPGLVGIHSGSEVLLGDFLHWQEAMAFAAIFDEAGFQRRLDPGYSTQIDVGFLLFAGGDLDIEIKQGLAIDDSHTQLFTLSCVDQHTLHCRVSLQALEPLPRVARYPKVSRRAIRLDRNTGRGIACVCQKADAFRASALIWCMRARKPFATARAASNLRFEPLRLPELYQPACPSNLSSGTRARADVTVECAYELSLDPVNRGRMTARYAGGV